MQRSQVALSKGKKFNATVIQVAHQINKIHMRGAKTEIATIAVKIGIPKVNVRSISYVMC